MNSPSRTSVTVPSQSWRVLSRAARPGAMRIILGATNALLAVGLSDLPGSTTVVVTDGRTDDDDFNESGVRATPAAAENEFGESVV